MPRCHLLGKLKGYFEFNLFLSGCSGAKSSAEQRRVSVPGMKARIWQKAAIANKTFLLQRAYHFRGDKYMLKWQCQKALLPCSAAPERSGVEEQQPSPSPSPFPFLLPPSLPLPPFPFPWQLLIYRKNKRKTLKPNSTAPQQPLLPSPPHLIWLMHPGLCRHVITQGFPSLRRREFIQVKKLPSSMLEIYTSAQQCLVHFTFLM